MTQQIQPPKNHLLQSSIRAGLASLGVSILIITLLMSLSDSHEFVGEIATLTLLTIPLTLALSLVAPLLLHIRTSLTRHILAVLLGIGLGLGWSNIVYSVFVNPFFGIFTVPTGLI